MRIIKSTKRPCSTGICSQNRRLPDKRSGIQCLPNKQTDTRQPSKNTVILILSNRKEGNRIDPIRRENHPAAAEAAGAGVGSTSLAEQLHVSSRTIKNHIKGINQEQPNLIQATAKGYILNKQMPLPVTKHRRSPMRSEFSYITHLFPARSCVLAESLRFVR